MRGRKCILGGSSRQKRCVTLFATKGLGTGGTAAGLLKAGGVGDGKAHRPPKKRAIRPVMERVKASRKRPRYTSTTPDKTNTGPQKAMSWAA